MRKTLLRMTLRQLQVFRAVCEHGSYSRAADEMALTQPAVSLQIRQLEELVGQPLFEYVGKKLYLTEAAEALRRASSDIFGRLESLDMQLSDLQGSLQGPVSYTHLDVYKRQEHGCIYCFARPSHAYWDMSPGIDFETRLIAKTNLAERLEEQLQKPGYVPQPIALGINTDAYQPIEREQRLTRQALEILLRYKHPLSIITKGSLILRDLDLLSELASHNLVSVAFSLTTLDDELKRIMEPRTAAPAARLRAMRTLHEAGVPAVSYTHLDVYKRQTCTRRSASTATISAPRRCWTSPT